MSTAFDLLAPGSASTLVLLGARVGGVVLVAPVFSARTVPVTLRTALLVLIAVLLQPAALGHLSGAPRLTAAALFTETLIGFAIGFGAAVTVGAAEVAGELMTVQIGLSGAAVLDPLTQQSTPVLGQFMQLLAVTLLLAGDAHLLMLDSLAASLRYLPVGAPVDAQAGFGAMVALGSTLFLLGLRFAAPVVAAVLVANVALAILSRAAPTLNVLSVAFPLQIGVGLLALGASLPLLAAWFTGWGAAYDGILTHLLGALAGAR